MFVNHWVCNVGIALYFQINSCTDLELLQKHSVQNKILKGDHLLKNFMKPEQSFNSTSM